MKNMLSQKFPPDLSSIFDEELANQLANTQGALGRLSQLSPLLPNPDLLMRPILAKEAESSSQLEGTQASLEDAYKIDLVEQTPEKRNEAQEIRNYEQAMLNGLKLLKQYPLNNFLIRSIHKTLMSHVRGKDKYPGQFRPDNVYIGQKGTNIDAARYVPPDATHIPQLMDDFERYLSQKGNTNILIMCGVLHYRFEAIHPFKDGNGRVGRLLISLFLIDRGLLSSPILYPSGFFERHKQRYMSALSKVDKNENWRSWLLYFLKGIENQSSVSLKIGLKIHNLFKRARKLIEKERASMNLIRVLEYTFKQPYISAPRLRAINIPQASGYRYLNILAKKGLLKEIGTWHKQKVYANEKLLSILRKI
ncbi:MAG: Fic family protein [bacterium]|nr:Fic family protein [bacterium]